MSRISTNGRERNARRGGLAAVLPDRFRVVGGVHQVIQIGRPLGRQGRQRNGGLAVVQGGGRQETTDRNLAVGHVQVQLVADPSGLVALAVLLHAHVTLGRQVVEHCRQAHGRLPVEAFEDLRSFLTLLRPSPFALGRRRCLLPRGRLLAGLDGRRVAGEVAHQPVAVGVADQRFVHALGQLGVRELGEGA